MEKDSSSVNDNLTSYDKWLLTYGYLVLVAALIGSLFLAGSGGYAWWDASHNNNLIKNELAFIQKTIHDDGLCITIDTHLSDFFARCPVISNAIQYKGVIPSATATTSCSPEKIEDNNENIRLNFQSGIHIPGMDFSMLVNPNTESGQIQQISSNPSFFNEIDISNPFIINQGGSLIFGDTSTIQAYFPMNDDGYNFGNAETFRNFNLFFIGSFPSNSASTDRCSTTMGLVGPSIYVLLGSPITQTKFCSCVPVQAGVVKEYCTSSLKLVGGISNAH